MNWGKRSCLIIWTMPITRIRQERAHTRCCGHGVNGKFIDTPAPIQSAYHNPVCAPWTTPAFCSTVIRREPLYSTMLV
jgi:hypothetical protein